MMASRIKLCVEIQCELRSNNLQNLQENASVVTVVFPDLRDFERLLRKLSEDSRKTSQKPS
ncbi:hypothetical protein F2Q68_00006464 [Brassica cretica]|uniref:Uncharacterized protein n=1 Tax=Brassica cretica TaxID=69181 RepID=A0A8S9JC36_BRACR|nr:hypothetical protein F2Q68_00006464 [Brassica cretica]